MKSSSSEAMTVQLELLADDINEYYKTDVSTDGDGLNRLMQRIGARLYYLSTVRAEVHEAYQANMKQLMDAGMSASKATVESDNRYPQMYALRRLLEEASRIHTACTVHISYLKTEKRQTRQGANA